MVYLPSQTQFLYPPSIQPGLLNLLIIIGAAQPSQVARSRSLILGIKLSPQKLLPLFFVQKKGEIAP
jgi:hypothetical protein